jgi:hypothetical protein
MTAGTTGARRSVTGRTRTAITGSTRRTPHTTAAAIAT